MPQIFDWPARMREVAAFVGLGSAELEVVQATAPVVLKHGEELTAAVYDHFLKFYDSRKFFLAEDGEIDEPKLDRRKHSLLRWLRGSIDFKLDEDYPIRVLATGIVHSHPPAHRAHLGSIPGLVLGSIAVSITGRVASGDRKTMGKTRARPARALPEIAHLALTVAMAPISSVPNGVPAPMHTLSNPIILPRISWGAESKAMVLCIVLNPA